MVSNHEIVDGIQLIYRMQIEQQKLPRHGTLLILLPQYLHN